jgi:hypothetical protein
MGNWVIVKRLNGGKAVPRIPIKKDHRFEMVSFTYSTTITRRLGGFHSWNDRASFYRKTRLTKPEIEGAKNTYLLNPIPDIRRVD